ncbi:mannosyl transferase [Nocardioides sp. Soil774]|uniref:glycosyltransferase n=1 Tax=Nocardioides sp. Soil774 TaxID=1736408 RepID=UPI0006FAA2AC|nr:glycosyltransferase [Nocardioides sp. Soil774]KRE97504.1 mannosyl transferase [Nocardioides sp. Soil774]
MTTDTRIHVAQVVTRFIAGAGGVALRGAMHLDPDRYRVTIVTGEGGRLTEMAALAGMKVIIEPSMVAPINPREDATALRRLVRICRDEQFDVVHTHSAKAGALGRLAAHRAGVPVIVHTYHGFPFHDFQDAVHHAVYVGIERRLARITDVVLAIGTGVATEALRRGLARPSALRTVPPVVDGRTVLKDATTTAAARVALGLSPDATVVGTVGRVDYQKAPEHFVAAIKSMQHREAVGLWIGSGPEVDGMRRLVGELGLRERMLFVGERDDVAALLPAFDVFAMASRYEGLPCAMVEAMRCGLPVVATAVNSVPDLVVPGESGVLVPAGRPHALARALDDLLDHRPTADRLALEGQVRAGAPFDAQRLSDVLDEVYSEALAASLLAAVG